MGKVNVPPGAVRSAVWSAISGEEIIIFKGVEVGCEPPLLEVSSTLKLLSASKGRVDRRKAEGAQDRYRRENREDLNQGRCMARLDSACIIHIAKYYSFPLGIVKNSRLAL